MPMQFVSFNFHLTQMRYTKAAMDVLPTYRPNGKTPAQVLTLIDAAKGVKANYTTKDTTLDLVRGNYHQAVKDGHTVAFQVYGIMKTRFRKVPAALGAIDNLPVDDDTPQKTQDRMEKISKLWPLLPNDPNTAAPFLPWTGMDQAAFNALFTTIGTQQSAFAASFQEFELAESNLHDSDESMNDFVVSSLEEGRSLYLPASTEREVIDAVPTEAASQEPNRAAISVATSPAPGAAHVVYDAAGATEFDVLHKGPGDAAFSVVADDVIVKVYDATGLAAGNHEYKVIGRNAQGPGPESAVATINVA